MKSSRLDQELVHRSLMPTRSGARTAVLDGLVVVDGVVATKPAAKVQPTSVIEVDPEAGRFVGRGAKKLLAAIESFEIVGTGKRAIDVGSSTGGFTEVLLGTGVAEVVAVDVGTDQLHDRLRRDSRVHVHEGTNIRSVSPVMLGAPFDLITVDLSFISLDTVADVLARLGGDGSDWIVLVKPQFELQRDELGKGGVVRSEAARRRALHKAVSSLAKAGLVTVGAIESPVHGGDGNQEALLWLRRSGVSVDVDDVFKVGPNG